MLSTLDQNVEGLALDSILSLKKKQENIILVVNKKIKDKVTLSGKFLSE